MRHMPSLSFEYDSQFESEQAIDRILDQEKSIGKFDPNDAE